MRSTVQTVLVGVDIFFWSSLLVMCVGLWGFGREWPIWWMSLLGWHPLIPGAVEAMLLEVWGLWAPGA